MFLSNFGLWQGFKIGLEVFHEYNSKARQVRFKANVSCEPSFMVVLSESWSLNIISLALLLVQLLGVWRLRSPVRILSLGLLLGLCPFGLGGLWLVLGGL
jgi:hypothetical protein